MKKLFYLYTIPRFFDRLYCPVMEAAFPEVESQFVMDGSLLAETLANNAVPTEKVVRRMRRHFENMVDCGADCIIVGCTALNTATKALADAFPVPIISIDEPMICRLLRDGCRKIAVLSHASVNAETIRRRLLAEDPTLTVSLFPVDGAADAFNDGRTDDFHSLMRNGAMRIPDGFDAIALGHISAENVDFSGISLPVYKTGESCVTAVREEILKI